MAPTHRSFSPSDSLLSGAGTPPIREAVNRCVIFGGLLTALSLFTAVHMYIVYMERAPIGWTEAVLSGFATWYPWLLLGPAIFWLARRFPLEPGRWGVSLLVHTPAGFAFGVLHGLLRAAVGPLVDSKPIPVNKIIVGQLLLTVLTYWVLVAAYQAVVNYRRYRERELRASQLESRLAVAHLEALRMQLNPHFLFNTLHAISALVHRDPDAADDMITQLSELLRMTLDNVGKQEVTLREELDFVQRYLDIQQTRFRDRLIVTQDIPSDTLDDAVPNQVLQPIVENAIRHGLDGRQGGGRIEIASRVAGQQLVLTVRDDGVGLNTDAAPAHGGIGLTNTRARMRQLYGQDAALELSNHPQGGTVVTLRIPRRREQDDAITWDVEEAGVRA